VIAHFSDPSGMESLIAALFWLSSLCATDIGVGSEKGMRFIINEYFWRSLGSLLWVLRGVCGVNELDKIFALWKIALNGVRLAELYQ